MKRSDDERLARRLGIRLMSRHPGAWGRAVLVVPQIAYRFAFPTLAVKRRQSIRCRPGVRFYATNFGAASDAEAWTQALEEFAQAFRPSARPPPVSR